MLEQNHDLLYCNRNSYFLVQLKFGDIKMAFYQVRDVMKRSCKDHQGVSEFYEEMQNMVENNEKLDFMLSSMKKHEDEVIHCMKEYLKEKNSPVLNSWFQYLPQTPKVAEVFSIQEVFSEDEALHIFDEINQKFEITYDKLSSVSQSEPVQELFNEMKKLTKFSGKREGWFKIMLDDM